VELLGLNEDFEIVSHHIEYINLQWTRRYFECGEFSVQIRMSDYDGSIKYIYSPDRPETGIIEKLHSDSDVSGEYVQLSGRFLEAFIGRDVVYPRFTASGTPAELVRSAISTYGVDVPELLFLPSDADGESTSVDWFGNELDKATNDLLRSAELSQRICYNPHTGDLEHEIWKGLDRTQSQDVNNYAFFSDANNSVDKISVDEDESGYRNFAIIAIEGGTLYYDARTDPNEPRRVKFFDQTSAQPDDGQTTSQFHQALIQQAKEELQNWVKINSVEASTIQSRLVYLRDYDLGDKCDIVTNDMRRSYESRIIEVYEVFKEGQHFVDVTFGDKIPTIYERLMNK